MSRLVLLFTGVVLGLAAVIGGWYTINQNYTYQGVLIDPPVPATDFQLKDQNGKLFQLSEQQGKVVLIFFGYTNCPDVCPVTLSEFRQIKQELGEQADNVRFVFVTVDPERDSQERMKLYMQNFDADFFGLRGEEDELEPILKAYGVYVEKQETGSAAGYLVDHTARTYTIDKQGNWRVNYPFGMEIDKIVSDIKHLIKE